jgi:hypothetical protein
MKTVPKITAGSCRPAPTPSSGWPLHRRPACSAAVLHPEGNGAGDGDDMTDDERLSLSVETIELAKVAAELRQAGRQLEADRLAIRVAENAARLATT